MSYANIMAKSCGEEEEEGGDEEEGEPPSLQEQEIEKMKLLFNQVGMIPGLNLVPSMVLLMQRLHGTLNCIHLEGPELKGPSLFTHKKIICI